MVREFNCKYCKIHTTSSRSDAVFCSRKCKQKYCKFPYRVHKKDYCEYCNFKALHSCQLDVDHIDGDHANNETDNLQTLCANCHRLKTYANKDWE